MIERNNTSVTLDRIFEDIYNLVTEANRIPLTDKVIIEANDLADALDELKAAIPKEVRNASQVLEEQKSIVNKAYEDADRIIEQAKAEAEDFANVTKLEALQYVDNMLEFFETRLSEDLKTLATNRDSVLFEIQKLNSVGKKAVAQADDVEE